MTRRLGSHTKVRLWTTLGLFFPSPLILHSSSSSSSFPFPFPFPFLFFSFLSEDDEAPIEIESFDEAQIETLLSTLRQSIAQKNAKVARLLEKKEDRKLIETLSTLSEIESIRKKRIMERSLQRQTSQKELGLEEPHTTLQKMGLGEVPLVC